MGADTVSEEFVSVGQENAHKGSVTGRLRAAHIPQKRCWSKVCYPTT